MNTHYALHGQPMLSTKPRKAPVPTFASVIKEIQATRGAGLTMRAEQKRAAELQAGLLAAKPCLDQISTPILTKAVEGIPYSITPLDLLRTFHQNNLRGGRMASLDDIMPDNGTFSMAEENQMGEALRDMAKGGLIDAHYWLGTGTIKIDPFSDTDWNSHWKMCVDDPCDPQREYVVKWFLTPIAEEFLRLKGLNKVA